MDDMRLREIDHRVMAAIKAQRDLHHAATAGRVALDLKVSKTYVIQVCERLKTYGYVSWSPNVPGSLHLVQEPPALPTSAPRSRRPKPDIAFVSEVPAPDDHQPTHTD
jgi:hypothetical protein